MERPAPNAYLERADCAWSADSVRLFGTPSEAARSSYLYMQEAGHFKTRPPYFTERANLNSFLVILTLSGEGELFLNGQSSPLTPGSCMLIDCMEHHLYRAAGEWEFLWLHFQGGGARGYYQEFCKGGAPVVPLPEDSKVEAMLRRILAVNRTRTAASELLTGEAIVRLLTALALRGCSGEAGAPQAPGYVRQARDYLDRHFKEAVPLEALARLLHVSKFHLAREFSRAVGQPPHEYQTGLRLCYAKELLKYSDQTVEDIALACGFANASHLIALFRAREGMTPRAFRSQWRSTEDLSVKK